MSRVIFNTIAVQDLEALEESLEKGASPIAVNEEGIRPLALVASLIKKSFEEEKFNEEDMYKKMAAMLIVHGAPVDDLHHEFGEVSNLFRFICRYIIDLSLERQDSRRVGELIEEERLWFEDEELETVFLDAINKGEKNRIDEMFDNEQVHYAYEQ